MNKPRNIPSTPAAVALTILERWDYPEDKYELDRWLASQRLRRLHARLDSLRGHLTIELTAMVKGPKERIDFGHGLRVVTYQSCDLARACHRIATVDLKCSRMGWRWLVAQAIRSCRRHLRLMVSE